MNTTTPPFSYSIEHSPSLPPFIFVVLACLALSPLAQAVNPPPDGGYPNRNTAEGDDALLNLTTGKDNTAIGHDAMKSVTDRSENTALGANALKNNVSGELNTATGVNALKDNIAGSANTATGFDALLNNQATNNTATGTSVLFSNTTGGDNTATGSGALFFNTTGSANTANGEGALTYNTTGEDNTADGLSALFSNTTGSRNTALGASALIVSSTGNNNIAVGFQAGFHVTTGSDNIDIANRGMMGDSGKIRIGTVGTHTNTFIAGISGVTVADGVDVIVNSNGRLGTRTSSTRFKREIKPMENTSEAILALKPVTFRYNEKLDPAGIPQFGLAAEDVEKVNPDLVARDEQGKPYSVRYEAVNAMLLNEFLKEHRKVEEQQAMVTQLRAMVEKQEICNAQQQTKMEGKPRP